MEKQTNPPAKVKGKYTFWGVFSVYQNQIAVDKGWNANTLKGYESSICNIIVPRIRGHDRTPLGELTRADFEETLAAIRKAGYVAEAGNVCEYDEDTLERFWYLMEVITETAAKNYICEDVLEENSVASRGVNQQKLVARKVVPRYMSPAMERRVGEILLTNPMQEGAFMGLAGMFCWGGRNAEAAGLNFGDVRLWQSIPGFWVAWVYKSTIIDSNKLQSSGKTRNADRVVVLPDRYVQLILTRKQRLQDILGPDVNVDELPVACRGDDYFARCSADDLTEAAKRLFRLVNLPIEEIEQAYEDVQAALAAEEDPLNRMNADQIEKEATAYYLRRVFGTGLACVGLTEEEVAFQIGHDLGLTPEYRNELLNTAKLLEIKAKMDMRPIVNGLCKMRTVAELPRNGAMTVSAKSEATYRVPANCRGINLHLRAKEPQDKIHVSVHTESGYCVHMSLVSYAVQSTRYRKELDVMADYHRLYNNLHKEDD